jgi:cystathionine gamma-synthase
LLGEQFGAVVSFELAGGRAAVNRLFRALQGIPFAPTLGDVCTMVSYPAATSHRSLTPAERNALGIAEGLVRVSVGIEEVSVIESAFSRAIAGVGIGD